jgi:anaerobic dimethyl sulfoxide reductase subunit B (iron-sulfur subunit)
MQLGFHFDQTRCVGCFTCCVACKDWNDIPAGRSRWLEIKEIVEGDFPSLLVAYLFRPCYHCAEPACRKVCPVEAISKRPEDGIVLVDRSLCLGEESCGLCGQACPYGAMQFGDENNPTAQKCDLCADRRREEKMPICVEACTMRALDSGPLEELRARYGDVREATGFSCLPGLKPSILFKGKTR